MEEQFYLTLPSNSILCNSSSCDTSSLNDYRIRLPHKIQLFNGTWEVGLSEIIYPHTWFNITGADDDWIVFQVASLSYGTRVHLPHGFYATTNQMLTAINWALKEAIVALKRQFPHKLKHIGISFEFDDMLQRVYMKVDGHFDVSSIYMADKLKYILGFDNFYTAPTALSMARYPVDLRGGFYALYIYCDLVDNQVVGDASVPLLRAVNIEGAHGEIICKVYDMPHYLPLTRKEFSAVEINIKDDSGRPVKFKYGKIIIKLHFRRRL